jgi:hypothetical protein
MAESSFCTREFSVYFTKEGTNIANRTIMTATTTLISTKLNPLVSNLNFFILSPLETDKTASRRLYIYIYFNIEQTKNGYRKRVERFAFHPLN